IAVVQRAKDELWVLPRGKLKSNESALAGARREVVEETGHRVRVREFLGAITYRARGRPKVVQFWRMQAEVKASRELMEDIVAVEWLPLAAAIRRLSYPLEKLFLRNVGRALRHRRHRLKRKTRTSPKGKPRKRAATNHARAASPHRVIGHARYPDIRRCAPAGRPSCNACWDEFPRRREHSPFQNLIHGGASRARFQTRHSHVIQ